MPDADVAAAAAGIAVGGYVNAGQVIGQVGRTGVSASPHLHFMLSRGWLIDPARHLRGGAPQSR